MGPMPRQHPRVRSVTAAAMDIRKAVRVAEETHNLTQWELVQILAEVPRQRGQVWNPRGTPPRRPRPARRFGGRLMTATTAPPRAESMTEAMTLAVDAVEDRYPALDVLLARRAVIWAGTPEEIDACADLVAAGAAALARHGWVWPAFAYDDPALDVRAWFYGTLTTGDRP